MLNWRAGPNGLLTADFGDIRLTVEAPLRFIGPFRYTILRRQYGPGSLFAAVGSGEQEDLKEAMASAEQKAALFASIE